MTTSEDILDDLGPAIFDMLVDLRSTDKARAYEVADKLESLLEEAARILADKEE